MPGTESSPTCRTGVLQSVIEPDNNKPRMQLPHGTVQTVCRASLRKRRQSSSASVVAQNDLGVFGDADDVEEGRHQPVHINELHHATFGVVA